MWNVKPSSHLLVIWWTSWKMKGYVGFRCTVLSVHVQWSIADPDPGSTCARACRKWRGTRDTGQLGTWERTFLWRTRTIRTRTYNHNTSHLHPPRSCSAPLYILLHALSIQHHNAMHGWQLQARKIDLRDCQLNYLLPTAFRIAIVILRKAACLIGSKLQLISTEDILTAWMQRRYQMW